MSSRKIEIANIILDNVKKARNFKSDADLAHRWYRNTSTISTWRKRGSISLEPLIEHEGDLNFNYIFFGDKPVWRDEIQDSGRGMMLHEPSVEYGKKSITERIKQLDLPVKEKLELLEGYIEVLEQLQSKPK